MRYCAMGRLLICPRIVVCAKCCVNSFISSSEAICLYTNCEYRYLYIGKVKVDFFTIKSVVAIRAICGLDIVNSLVEVKTNISCTTSDLVLGELVSIGRVVYIVCYAVIISELAYFYTVAPSKSLVSAFSIETNKSIFSGLVKVEDVIGCIFIIESCGDCYINADICISCEVFDGDDFVNIVFSCGQTQLIIRAPIVVNEGVQLLAILEVLKVTIAIALLLEEVYLDISDGEGVGRAVFVSEVSEGSSCYNCDERNYKSDGNDFFLHSLILL